jgi:hypothetical protein
MDRNAVLVKTGKGAEEVKSRTFGLAARLRSVLIMVDGNSTVAEYVARCGAIPAIEGSLQQLLDQGFVESRASAAAAPPVAAQAAAPAANPSPSSQGTGAAADAEPLPATQKDAVIELSRIMIDSMGPNADAFTGRLESARTRVEFVEMAERCALVLDNLGARGKARAVQFRARAQLVAERFFGA